MISFAAHKPLSVVGEVDPEKEIGSESETALEITEEIESETEVVIEKERERKERGSQGGHQGRELRAGASNLGFVWRE